MKVQICKGSSCSGKFSKYIKTRLENDTKFCNWRNIDISECSCMGQCKKAPNIKIGNQTYNYMSPQEASKIITKEKK